MPPRPAPLRPLPPDPSYEVLGEPSEQDLAIEGALPDLTPLRRARPAGGAPTAVAEDAPGGTDGSGSDGGGAAPVRRHVPPVLEADLEDPAEGGALGCALLLGCAAAALGGLCCSGAVALSALGASP